MFIALDLVEEEVEDRPPLISVSRSSSFDSKDAVAPLEMAITFDFEEAEDSMASDRSAVEEEEEGLASSEAVCSLVLGSVSMATAGSSGIDFGAIRFDVVYVHLLGVSCCHDASRRNGEQLLN